MLIRHRKLNRTFEVFGRYRPELPTVQVRAGLEGVDPMECEVCKNNECHSGWRCHYPFFLRAEVEVVAEEVPL